MIGTTFRIAILTCAALTATHVLADDDVSEEVDAVRELFFKQAREAREEYRNDLKRHARIAVSKLEKVASSAIRSGDLPGATEAWKQVLWLDRENRKAVAHFKTIGTLDKVLEELEDEPILPTSSSSGSDSAGNSKLGAALVGTVWSWGTDRTLQLGPGTATVSDDPRPNSRTWWLDQQGNVHLYTNPVDYYEILRFDPGAKTYSGSVFKLHMKNKSGRRLR